MANWNASISIPAHIIRHGSGNLVVEPESWIPEDAEVKDLQNLRQMIDDFFDKSYPEFEPEIIHALDKDYFLPALKVLSINNDKFVSPARTAIWEDMELRAECVNQFSGLDDFKNKHKSPHAGCDCGIYGSVNMEEIQEYIQSEINKARTEESYCSAAYEIEEINSKDFSAVVKYVTQKRKLSYALCIIEPYPDSKVVLCRKGWKASHAFVSEIVDKTIGAEDASRLLSIAWHRDIDVREIKRFYENW